MTGFLEPIYLVDSITTAANTKAAFSELLPFVRLVSILSSYLYQDSGLMNSKQRRSPELAFPPVIEERTKT